MSFKMENIASNFKSFKINHENKTSTCSFFTQNNNINIKSDSTKKEQFSPSFQINKENKEDESIKYISTEPDSAVEISPIKNDTNSNSLTDTFNLEFLPSPSFKSLPYTEREVELYSNLYQITHKKNYILYEYAVKFQHDEVHLSTQLKRKVLSKVNAQISEKYGVYIFTGNSLFAVREIKQVAYFNSICKKFQYSIVIQPTSQLIQIRDDPGYLHNLYLRKPLIKTITELIIKDILRHNPSLKFVKNLYGQKYSQKDVKAYDHYNSISIQPGFSTKVMFFENGIYLNVDKRNKILSNSHCLNLIESFIDNKDRIKRDEINKINNFFKGRTIETIHTNQRFKVESINFERRANNHSINFENTTVILTKYYKNLYDLDIQPDSPLIQIKSKSTDFTGKGIYYPPQLCLMGGRKNTILLYTCK